MPVGGRVPTSGAVDLKDDIHEARRIDGTGYNGSAPYSFQTLRNGALYNKFDPTYLNGATSLSQINSFSQWRNYPRPAGTVWQEISNTSGNGLRVGLYDGTKAVACGGSGGIPGNARISTATYIPSGYTSRVNVTLDYGIIIGVARATTLGNYIALPQGFVGVNSRSYTSSDGISWTLNSFSFIGIFQGIASNNSIYCLVGGNGVYSSTNGTFWTQRVSNGFADICHGITVGDSGFYSRFVAVGSERIWYSDDGTSWSSASAQIPFSFTNKFFDKVTHVPEIAGSSLPYGFYALEFISTSQFALWRSTTGLIWFPVTTSGASFNFQINRIRYFKNKLYILGDNGNILESSNGTSFTNLKSNLPTSAQSTNITDIIYDSTYDIFHLMTPLLSSVIIIS
jgi:hypothetical protein